MSRNNNMTTSSSSSNESSYDIKNEQYIEDPWTIIESYFKAHHLERLVRHQLESYNNFVGYQINKTIEMFNPVTIASDNDYDPVSKKHSLEIVVNFVNFQIYRPQIHENNGATKLMFPQEARLRNFTYASAMTIDLNIKYIIRTGASLDSVQILHKAITKIHIGKLPIMLKSNICVLNQYKHVENTQLGECKYDAGGYFIINGSEKTVLGQERAAENRVYCYNVSKNNTKYNWISEIKSVPDFKCISPKQINVMVSSKNNGFGYAVYVQIPRIKQDIPLFIVFRAIGVITDKEICEKILLDINVPQYKEISNNLQASIIEANGYLTQEDCIKYITSYAMFTPINMDRETGAKKKLDFTMDVLNNDLFPHCHNNHQKIYFLGYMTFRILLANFQMANQDDRDSYLNKRVDLTGTLLNNLFRNYFNKLVKDMEKQVIREINNGSWKSRDDYESIINMTNIYKIIKSTTIENGLKRALATGDFGVKHTTNSNKVGVAQVLNRLTYVSSLSHARRISTPTDKSGKLIPPRKLHNSSWGYLCLTGDVDVLLSNRMDSKKIKDIRNGDWVNTVNRETLLDEPSDMYQYFSKMPDKLYEITTISGRKIKATADHPFLVKVDDIGTATKYEMKKVCDLTLNDKVIIRHVPHSIPDENTTVVMIRSEDVLEHYRMDLFESNLLNVRIPTFKLKIIARLIGALNTDGNIHIRGFDKNAKLEKSYYNSSFSVGEKYDVFQLVDDIQTLGFGSPSITRSITKFEDKKTNRTTIYNTWCVSKDGAFAYLMSLLGGFVGKKTGMKRELPEWLTHAESSIKREFLSGFQGGDGSKISYQQNINTYKISLGITCQTTHNTFLDDTINYMSQIIQMFKEFNIHCHLNQNIVDKEKTIVCITFENTSENLIRYANVVHYAYCEEKRRKSAPAIEHLKIREFAQKERNLKYDYIINNYKDETSTTLFEKTSIPKRQIQKIVLNHKKGIRQTPRFSTDVVYNKFIEENLVDNGCVSVQILSIIEIEPELVYDFTTRSENHSFVASSFVLSNCSAETPEGASVGIVKNLSYMTHITIHSNSLPLYEYVFPFIRKIEEIDTSYELYDKVKVFINGAWLGITEEPYELFLSLKEKKYKGIINIYTSIVFNYTLKEIRLCNDGGRVTRPVLRVKNKNIMITQDILARLKSGDLIWDNLLTSSVLDNSIIEYIDPEEQAWSMIATFPKEIIADKGVNVVKYTHCEIHPSTIFGILASCIPFPEHNQSPRNTYQCLDINETVLMSDGSKKRIADISIGDGVVSFHPETMETSITKVTHHYVRETCKKIYKITTVSGREIIATEDHKFMTSQGWMEVQQIVPGNTKIGIYINNQNKTSKINVEKKCILTEEEFITFFLKNGLKMKLIMKYVNELKDCNLLPIHNDNGNLNIISRIFGFILADGSINIYTRKNNSFTSCSLDFGTIIDVTAFENDITHCGFRKCKYYEGTRQFNDVAHHTFSVTHNGALPALLLSLGITYGRKTETNRNSIPKWIMEGNSIIKKEFISGFQGGDGCKIRWNKMKDCYNFVCAETSQQINPLFKESLIYFMNQCCEILKEFNIEVGIINETFITTERIKIGYKISDKHENLISYYDEIGYKYSNTKNVSSAKVVEYLKFKRTIFKKHVTLIEEIRSMHDNKLSNSHIANKLNIKCSKVSDIIRSYKNNRKISMPNLNQNNIINWLENIESLNDALFVEVHTIEEVENRLISDITVESDNHSFIAGDHFLSSNCAQGKQAMGVYVTNYENRMDKTAYVLNYPARPLVDTRVMNLIQLNKIPSGTNVIVAIMTHTGYNQEDSLIFNKGSIDRGLFVTTIYHTEKDEDKQKINGDEEIRCNPDKTKTKGMKMGNYSKVNSKGVVPENTIVENRDIIIAKVVPIKENRNDNTKVIKFEDQSKIYKTTEETFIDKNYIDRNGEGYNFAKVRLRTFRKPVIGDKFSSRHGKSYLTIE